MNIRNLFALCAFAWIAMLHPAQAFIVWGYDGSTAAQQKYLHVFPSAGANGCTQLTRNTNSNFILREQRDYLSGIGIRVAMAGATCIGGLDYVHVSLVTPRHILVALHWGIWSGVQTFAFLGTDGQIYTAKTVPSSTKILKTPMPAVSNTDMGLIELDRDLPPQVIPFHIVTPAMQNAINATGAQTYNFGNLATTLGIEMVINQGNPNFKAVGVNSILPNTLFAGMPFLTLGIIGLFHDPPTPGSQNWVDYWYTQYAPLPAVGTGFPRILDSGAPTLIKAADAQGRMRLFLIGNHRDWTMDNYIPGVFTDLQTQISRYNSDHRTNYTLNAAPIVMRAKDVLLKKALPSMQLDLP